MANIDISHLVLSDTSAKRLEVLAGKTAHVHISVCDGKVHGDLPPGRGVVEFVPYLEAIQSIGFEGAISIELEYSPEPDRIVEWVTEAYEATHGLMSQAGIKEQQQARRRGNHESGKGGMSVSIETESSVLDPSATIIEQGTLPQRLLGDTGELVPILGLGTAPAGIGMGDRDAISLFNRAIDRGITYVDTAPAYDRAQSQLGQLVPARRDEIFLVTKTTEEDGVKAVESLEQSLKSLGTDYVDLVYVHSMGGRNVDAVLSPGGSLNGLRKAQEQGLTRFVGFTAHNAPWKARKMLEATPVDVIMLALNSADRHTYDFEEQVLPLAVEKGVGIVAMKVYGGAPSMEYEKPTRSALAEHGNHDHETALRYALGLPVATAVVGIYNEVELDRNVQWACRFRPLQENEEARILETGKKIAADWGPHYGPVE